MTHHNNVINAKIPSLFRSNDFHCRPSDRRPTQQNKMKQQTDLLDLDAAADDNGIARCLCNDTDNPFTGYYIIGIGVE